MTFIIIIVTPVLSLAHAGHGHENPLSPTHYFVNSVHATQVALTITAAVIVAAWMWRRVTSKK